jgi:hypothetical protein
VFVAKLTAYQRALKKEERMSHLSSKKKIHILVVIFGLLLMLPSNQAQAQNYNLNSLFSINVALGSGDAPSVPSINNFGEVAYQRVVRDPVLNQLNVIMIHDGNSETPFFTINTVFGTLSGAISNVVINDNGAVAAKIVNGSSTSPCGNVDQCIIRINPDKSLTVLATVDIGGAPADFRETEQWISFNKAGQVAIKVRNHDLSTAIVRLDDTGITEIARQTATFNNFSQPTINDSGVVTFSAQDQSSPPGGIYTGTGQALTLEAPIVVTYAPFINNNGLILGSNLTPNLVFTAQGGMVTTLVTGNEDPVLDRILVGLTPLSQNDFGDFVFASQNSTGTEFGLFTGNDPSQDKVFRSSDTIFGGSVSDVRTNLHYINNFRQIVFAITVTDPSGHFFSHIVRADPVPQDNTPPDTSITSSPALVTNSANAIFSFTSTEAGSTFECSLDGAAFAACTSPTTYNSLADGDHDFQVRATDPAGNTDTTPASFTWTIDATAPETTITVAPPASTNDTSANFDFISSEAGSTFECSLDGAPFTTCTSSQSYSNLANGSHTFLVRATDPVGNTDPTPKAIRGRLIHLHLARFRVLFSGTIRSPLYWIRTSIPCAGLKERSCTYS